MTDYAFRRFLMENYFSKEDLKKHEKEFKSLNLPEDEFGNYLAYIYEMENQEVNKTCW